MDKKWVFKNRLSSEYALGVDSFLQFAKENAEDINFISCPCVSCGNMEHDTIPRVRAHLFRNGMDKNYLNWHWHGERHEDRDHMHDSHEISDAEDFPNKPLDVVHAAYENTGNLDKMIALLEDVERPLNPGCSKFTNLSAIEKLYDLKTKHSWSNVSMKDLLALLSEMLPENNTLPMSNNM